MNEHDYLVPPQLRMKQESNMSFGKFIEETPTMNRGPSHIPGIRGEANIPTFTPMNPENDSPNRKTRGAQHPNNQSQQHQKKK